MIVIDWNHLFLVAAAAIVASSLDVALFSFGMRLLVNADSVREISSTGDSNALRREAANRAGAYVMFALSSAAVIYGVLLIIPNLIPNAA